MLAIFKRELKMYFLSPIGYVFLSIFLLLTGIFFSFGSLQSANPDFTSFLSSILFLFLLVVPILTMRLFTDEKRMKTDQLLLTSPVKVTGIVFGKYLAAVVFFLIALAVTGLYTIVIIRHGTLQVAQTLGGYFGFILIGACFISIGLFVSSTTDNQVVSAILTFFSMLFLWLLDSLRQALPADVFWGLGFICLLAFGLGFWIYISTKNWPITMIYGGAALIAIVLTFILSKNLYVGVIGRIFDWFSLKKRYNSFSLGILKITDVVYYLTFAGFFVHLTIRGIENQRWK